MLLSSIKQNVPALKLISIKKNERPLKFLNSRKHNVRTLKLFS